ncbi:MAG: PilZ domain-containing protein [Candidatus Omnitrophica bacterium]|nr:PilZ domain-containing protein [Candidatus Omnitrophota bacterium]
MSGQYSGAERREFVRIEYATPLAYKVCRKETVSKLLQGYTSDVSQSGLLCKIGEKVNKDDIIWLSFDRAVLGICEEIEKRVFIYQNGIIGKVARVDTLTPGTFDVGVHFIIREEKNDTNIFPKVHFLSADSV